MGAEAPQTNAQPPPGGINKQTYISLGMVVVLIAGAIGFYVEIGSVRSEIIPKIARIETKVESIAEDVRDLKNANHGRLTEAQVQALIQNAILPLREKIDAHERRIDQLERKD